MCVIRVLILELWILLWSNSHRVLISWGVQSTRAEFVPIEILLNNGRLKQEGTRKGINVSIFQLYTCTCMMLGFIFTPEPSQYPARNVLCKDLEIGAYIIITLQFWMKCTMPRRQTITPLSQLWRTAGGHYHWHKHKHCTVEQSSYS